MLKNVPLDKETDELKELVKKNLEVTNDIHEIAIYVKKYIFWQKIFGVLKLFFIIVPIIISIIYLPPLLKQLLAQYESIVNLKSGVNAVPMELKEFTPNIFKFWK